MKLPGWIITVGVCVLVGFVLINIANRAAAGGKVAKLFGK